MFFLKDLKRFCVKFCLKFFEVLTNFFRAGKQISSKNYLKKILHNFFLKFLKFSQVLANFFGAEKKCLLKMTWKGFCVKKISIFLSWSKDDIKKVSVIQDHFPASKLKVLNGFGFRGPWIIWIWVNCYLFQQKYKLWTTLRFPPILL